MILVLFAILLAVAAVEPASVEVSLLDGTTVAGPITAWDATGVTVAGADGPRTIATAELLELRSNPPEPGDDETEAPTTTLDLIDGSQLAILSFTTSERIATIATPLAGEPLSIPTDRIRRVEFAPSGALAAMWLQLENHEAAGDVLVVTKREAAQLDYLAGVVGDVTAEEVAFDWDGQKVPIKRSKVAAIEFYHAEPAKLPAAVCELTLSSGATLPARKLSLADNMLQVETPAGATLNASLASIVRADFSAGKLAYLSDLKPAEVRWTPRIALPDSADLLANYGAPRNNVSYAGSQLTLAWPDESLAAGRELRSYAKGLALRSRTEVTYRLPAGMQRFTAIAGIDPATTDQGHVQLEIRADGQVIWEGEIDGRRPPVELDLPIKAARRLQFFVDYGRNLDYGDRLHLVEARVTQ